MSTSTMENNIEELISVLPLSSTFTFGIREITNILEKHNVDLSPAFITDSYASLLTLECWAWKVFSKDSYQWLDQPNYLTLFRTLALFNKNLILNYESIETKVKASLLIPNTTDQITGIFEQIERDKDDNDPFIGIVSLWFDNLSIFIHEYPEFETSPIISYVNQNIGRNYLMTEQFKFFLIQLQQPKLPKSNFTTKQLFYMKTCPFSLSSYFFAKAQNFPFTSEEMMSHISNDFIQVIETHSHIIDMWSEQLLSCITHLTGMIAACSWWGGEKAAEVHRLFSSDQMIYSFVNAIIRIISYKPFYPQIIAQWSNNETILIDMCLFSLKNIAQNQDLLWFFRSKITLPETLLTIADFSMNDKICLRAYIILGEILCNERLKDLKITDNLSFYFYDMLEHAWQNSSKKYKQTPIGQLLRSLLILTSIDAIQQKTADLNKIPLLIEISDQYPITFDILWALSFNQDIQHQLRSNTAFISKVSHLANEGASEQIRKITHGILWNLDSNHEDRAISELSDEKPFDIMISYSHKDETICKRIYEELVKAGYLVWIDFDQMHGNVMDAMAQAIERSQTIIICMSEQYRRSNYCRAEAHYAFQRELKIVPILLQEHYQPDGWLLFLIGQLLYIDYTKYEFSRAMDLLMKELRAEDYSESITPIRSRTGTASVLCNLNLVVKPSTPLHLPKDIQDWTKTHVQDWLIEQNLQQMSQLLHNCDGRGLLYLNEFLKNGETKQVINLLQEDSVRRTNETLSLVELSYLRALLDQQRHGDVKSKLNRRSTRRKKHSSSCCQSM